MGCQSHLSDNISQSTKSRTENFTGTQKSQIDNFMGNENYTGNKMSGASRLVCNEVPSQIKGRPGNHLHHSRSAVCTDYEHPVVTIRSNSARPPFEWDRSNTNVWQALRINLKRTPKVAEDATAARWRAHKRNRR